MYLIYGPQIKNYSSLMHSMETAFQIMVGKIQTSEAMMCQPILTPIIMAAYNLAIIYFSLNIFVSIIIEAFDRVRTEAKNNPNQFDFYTHVADKLKKSFRRNSSLLVRANHMEYKDYLSILSNRVNTIMNYILRVYKVFQFNLIFVFSEKCSII